MNGQRVVDHRLVINGKQLLGGDLGQGVQSGAGASGKNDTFHNVAPIFLWQMP